MTDEPKPKTTFKLSNWFKPTPDKWQKIGDTALYIVLPIIEAGIGQFVPPEYKAVAMFGYMALSLIIKGLTKLTHVTTKLSPENYK